ncbi:winged helix-turn-helix domain-containing protein [Sphingorhabdus sp. SMR4y]|uniref:winged helix-turn-helix domain-containing protein n=1 Tax=Sphingorhabdus sp. SMR4y TaxID=2584094 RepID=UPI000B5CFAB9|nr:winged helix-turn-helix domain-containing protein [Sphingorhabdus sp. SMR4y]ASK87334.1 transcriptional regulator HilA [Sphingorhabdus sp. SMR4y]
MLDERVPGNATGNGIAQVGKDFPSRFLINNIGVRTASHIIGDGDNAVRVEPKVMTLLQLLSRSPNRIVSRDALLEEIWPDGLGGDESLTRLIYQLRRACRSFPALENVITTVSKSGYRLDATVQVLEGDTAIAPSFADGNREYNLSVAVLPVTDHDNLAENGYLADGLSRDLTSLLATTPMLFVAPYSSVLALYDQSRPLDVIARKIGCRFILTGSFRRRDEQIILRFELVDTLDASLAWSGKYNSVLDQFFEIQNDVLLSVSTAISTQLRYSLSLSLPERQPFRSDVYRILQATETLRYRYGKETAQEIVALLQQGLADNPDNAVLLAGLAVQLSQNVVSQWEPDPVAARISAFQHIDRALVLEPANAEVLASAGVVNTMFHQPKEAIALLRRAIVLDPNNAHALAILGWQICLLEQNPEGIRMIEAAEKRAPHHPRFGLWATYRATGHLFMLDYEAAAPACEQAILRTPDYYQPRMSLAWALVGLGEDAKALASIRKAEAFEGEGITCKFVEEIRQWSNNSPNAAQCAEALEKLIPLSQH